MSTPDSDLERDDEEPELGPDHDPDDPDCDCWDCEEQRDSDAESDLADAENDDSWIEENE